MSQTSVLKCHKLTEIFRSNATFLSNTHWVHTLVFGDFLQRNEMPGKWLQKNSNSLSIRTNLHWWVEVVPKSTAWVLVAQQAKNPRCQRPFDCCSPYKGETVNASFANCLWAGTSLPAVQWPLEERSLHAGSGENPECLPQSLVLETSRNWEACDLWQKPEYRFFSSKKLQSANHRSKMEMDLGIRGCQKLTKNLLDHNLHLLIHHALRMRLAANFSSYPWQQG